MHNAPMDVEKLPDFNPPQFGDVVDPDRPILSFAWQAEAPHRLAAHSHERAHIIQPVSGVYWVVAAGGTWLVPVGQAIWIAPMVFHQVYARGPVSARMLFVDKAYADELPSECGAVGVNPLLSELLARALDHGNDYEPGGPMGRLASVILDELAELEVAPLLLPGATDSRVLDVMALLADDPASNVPLPELARAAGAATRTMARLFRAETGMSFAQWKTRLRLVRSIELLQRGAPVTEVALELGYGSASSFVYMFRTNLGTTPGRYRQNTNAG